MYRFKKNHCEFVHGHKIEYHPNLNYLEKIGVIEAFNKEGISKKNAENATVKKPKAAKTK